MQCKVSNMQLFKYVVFFRVLCLKSGTSKYNNITVMKFYLLTLIYLLNIHKFILSIKFKIFRAHLVAHHH